MHLDSWNNACKRPTITANGWDVILQSSVKAELSIFLWRSFVGPVSLIRFDTLKSCSFSCTYHLLTYFHFTIVNSHTIKLHGYSILFFRVQVYGPGNNIPVDGSLLYFSLFCFLKRNVKAQKFLQQYTYIFLLSIRYQ